MPPSEYDYSALTGYARAIVDWIPWPSTATKVKQEHLDRWDQAINDLKSITFNVRDYGAKGDGGTDDTTAIQAALDACVAAGGGIVFFPKPSSSYKVTSTINIVHATSGNVAYVHLMGSQAGFGSAIQWTGGNNSSVFRTRAWKLSIAQNLHVNLGTATGMVAWDVDGDTNYTSSAFLQFLNCHVNVRTGASNIGWRMGHSGGVDISYVGWKGCIVDSDTAFGAAGQTGWVWEHSNCLVFHWDCCSAQNLARGWTGIATSGSFWGQNGAGGHTWTSCGGTQNTVDFELPYAAPYTWDGGRFETGKTFLQLGGNSGASHAFTLNGVAITNYGQGSVEATFNMTCPANLVLTNCYIDLHSHTAALFTLNNPSGGFGSLTVNGGGIYTAVDPVYTVSSGTWSVYFRGVQKLDASDIPVGYLADRGDELGYTQFTGAVSVTATSEATANTVVTASAISFDGNTPVMIEFFSPYNSNPSATVTMVIVLYEGASSIGLWSQLFCSGTEQVPLKLERRLTPASGSKTYSVRAYVASGTGTVGAGAGGVGANMPGFIRIRRA